MIKMLCISLLALSLTSCGESPLLNHKMEKSFGKTYRPSVQADEFRLSKSGLSFSLDWMEPPHVGEGRFNLKIWKSDVGTVNGPYKDPAGQLHVFLWMPTMGHGSSPVKITKTATGEYEVSNVYFIMGGKWEVKFQLLSGGKVVDETVLSYSL